MGARGCGLIGKDRSRPPDRVLLRRSPCRIRKGAVRLRRETVRRRPRRGKRPRKCPRRFRQMQRLDRQRKTHPTRQRRRRSPSLSRRRAHRRRNARSAQVETAAKVQPAQAEGAQAEKVRSAQIEAVAKTRSAQEGAQAVKPQSPQGAAGSAGRTKAGVCRKTAGTCTDDRTPVRAGSRAGRERRRRRCPLSCSGMWSERIEGLEDFLAQVAEVCMKIEGVEGAGFAVRIVGDAQIQQLSTAKCAAIDRPTDVLSFPTVRYPQGTTARGNPRRLRREYDPYLGYVNLGDCVLNLDRAREQAAEYGHSLRRRTRVSDRAFGLSPDGLRPHDRAGKARHARIGKARHARAVACGAIRKERAA